MGVAGGIAHLPIVSGRKNVGLRMNAQERGLANSCENATNFAPTSPPYARRMRGFVVFKIDDIEALL